MVVLVTSSLLSPLAVGGRTCEITHTVAAHALTKSLTKLLIEVYKIKTFNIVQYTQE
jgi:hypothetical protein